MLLLYLDERSGGGSTGSIFSEAFDAQRERLDLRKDAERTPGVGGMHPAELAGVLRRCAERARVLALRDRDARREELELQEDAAFQIQRCVQCYLFNRLFELRFQAAAQRLDAEREQRRRVTPPMRGEMRKAQELAEQALKQVELSSWKMAEQALNRSQVRLEFLAEDGRRRGGAFTLQKLLLQLGHSGESSY